MLRLCQITIGVLFAAATFSAAPLDTRVADAAMKSQKEVLRSLVRQGADVNAAHGDGMTALHWAASHGDFEMSQVLITAAANVKATTRLGGYTPLILAARAGSATVIDLLLKSGADANIRNGVGVSALMLASASGNAEAVKILLDHGADANARESVHGQTPLMFAAAANRIDAIQALVARGASPGAATTVRMPAVRGLGGNAPPTVPGAPDPPAAVGGRSAGAQARRDPNNDDPPPVEPDPTGGLTPLLYAVREGHIEAVQALLSAGASVNQASGDKTSPLLMASINGRFDIAMYLLERGADPKLSSTAGTTPLFAALNSQWAPHAFYPQPSSPHQQKVTHIELMKALLARGADPNARVQKKLWYTFFNAAGQSGISEAGATALWRAAQASDVDAIRVLVAAGADPNLASEDGVSPLNVAAGNGWRGNLNVNAPFGFMPAVRYLVEIGADVNSADKTGYTPLHGAAERGDNEMIVFLVSKGADVTVVTKRGQTTVDVANGPRQRIQPYPETIALLVALGAKNSHKCVSC